MKNFVSTSTFNYELIDAVVISQTEKFGRVLHSTREISARDIVFVEKPILFSIPELTTKEQEFLMQKSTDTGLNLVEDFLFVKAFCLSTKANQLSVLDCFTPPMLDVRKSQLLSRILKVVDTCKMYDWGENFNYDTLQKVVLIKACNAHGCFSQGNKVAALYSYGSKMRHSCTPNVVYTSQRRPGFGCFIAKRDIRAGEELCISYIPVQTSVPMRKTKLRENYLFECDCSLCVKGVDKFRGIACTCGDTLYLNLDTSVWSCVGCCACFHDGSQPVSESMERSLVNEGLELLDSIKIEIRSQVIQLLERLLCILGPNHAITKLVQKAYIEHHLISSYMVLERHAEHIISMTDSILEWCENDPDFLDSALVEIACGLGRTGEFKKAIEYLTIVKDDMDRLFGEESENEIQELVNRAILACKQGDAESVPDFIGGTNI